MRIRDYPIIALVSLTLLGTMLSSCPNPNQDTPDPSPVSRYTVAYEETDAISGSPPTDPTEYLTGNTVTVLPNSGVLLRTGYDFGGWSTVYGGGTQYQPGESFMMGTSNIVLYPVWIELFSVTYFSTGHTSGDVPVDNEEYRAYDTVTVLDGGTLFKTAYSLAGWNTRDDFQGITYRPGDTFDIGPSDVSLYAEWTTDPDIDVGAAGSLTANLGSYTDITCTITNYGFGNLELNGTPLVAIGGGYAGAYTIQSPPGATSIASGGSTTFIIRFTPVNAIAYPATFSIACNDPDENPYTFDLTCTGTTTPEIGVSQGGTPLASGSSYDFSDTMTGEYRDAAFTISNTNYGSLNIESCTISGTNASEFSIISAPPASISYNQSGSFTVRFQPLSTGEKTATITLENNDLDEDPYTITLTSTALNWHGIKSIDTAGSVGQYASLGTYMGNIYIAYYDETNTNLKVTRSSNYGATWTASTVISTTMDVGRYASLGVYQNNVYVSSWVIDTDRSSVVFKSSADSGATWGGTLSPVPLTTGMARGQHAALGQVSGGFFAIAYHDGNDTSIRVAATTAPATIPWTTNTEVDNSADVGQGIALLAESPYRVVIAYIDATGNDVEYAFSGEAGVTFGTKSTVYDGNIGMKEHLAIATNGTQGTYFVAFCQGNMLGFKRTSDYGVNWSTLKQVDLGIGDLGGRMSMIHSGSTTYLAYFTGSAIKLVKSTDNGDTWGTPVTVTSVGSCYGLSMKSGTAALLIAYHDGGTNDLKLAASLDWGTTW